MPRIRILLADPNASMVAMLADLLSEEFEIVGAVYTGADTLRCTSEKQPDVIVLDVVLRDMNGLSWGNRCMTSFRVLKSSICRCMRAQHLSMRPSLPAHRDTSSNPGRAPIWRRRSRQFVRVKSLTLSVGLLENMHTNRRRDYFGAS